MSLALSNRDGGKTSERGLYDSIGAHLSGEVISGFRVRQADPVSMNVRVGGEYNSTTGSGKDSILIRDGLRTYDVFIDDGVAVTATVSAAHASLARIDTVVVYVDKSVARTKTLVDNTNGVVKVKVVSGTPNASPVAPDDTAIQSSVGSGNPFAKLANIAVAANATNILDSHITDKRNYASVSNLSGVFSDYIVPGTGVIAVSSGLTCTISDITYYINGIRYTKTGISNKTFTASKDTYCFIDTAGNITYSEVANNAAAPAAPANSICFGLVVSSVSSIWYISMFDSKPAFRLTRSAAFSIPRSSTTRYAYDVIAYNYGLNRPRTNPGEGSQGGIVIQQPGVYDLKAFVLVGDNPTNIGLHIAVNGTKVASGSNGTYAYPGLHFAEDMKFDKGDVVEVRLTNLVSDRDPFTEYQTAMFSGHLVRPA